MYKVKLQCPQCGGKDIALREEIISVQYTYTNKRTGWLSQKVKGKPIYWDKGAYFYQCKNCGCRSCDVGESQFIVEEIEVEEDV